MTGARLWMVVLLILSCQGPTRAAEPEADTVRWVRQARAVWRTYSWHSRPEQERAVRAALSEGRRKATREFRRLLRERSASDPSRFPVAFTMALLDLDYRAGREVLLQYARDETAATKLSPSEADPGAAPSEGQLSPEGLPLRLYDVYRRRHDPVLVRALLDMTPRADGGLADGLAGVLGDLARDHPRGLLQGLRRKPEGAWRATAMLLAFEGRYAGVTRVAAARRDALRPAARRLLRYIQAETHEPETKRGVPGSVGRPKGVAPRAGLPRRPRVYSR